MKRSTETRLLLTILLSSLIPVLALGFLTTAAVYRMGNQLGDLAAEARHRELHTRLQIRALEKADALVTFLRSREDELRALSLLPTTTDNYLAFYWSTLGVISVSAGDNEYEEKIWIPLYREVSFLDPQGNEVVTVRGGEALPPDRLQPHPLMALNSGAHKNSDPADIPHIILLPSISPAEKGTTAPGGTLRITLHVNASPSHTSGTLVADVDVRQLMARLNPLPRSITDDRNPRQKNRHMLFFDPQGNAFLYPQIPAATDDPLAGLLRRELPGVIAGLRNHDSGLVQSTDPEALLAFAPIMQQGGPYEEAKALGGVLICSDLSEWAVPDAATRVMASLTQKTEIRIGILTLVSILGVAMAALLVAQRMAQPWIRLREKARTVVDGNETDDEIAEIARSFDSLASQVAVSTGQLRASQKRLSDFIEMTPDGIAVTDTSGRILHYNRALCQMFRRTPEELGTITIRDLWVNVEDWEEMVTRLRAAGRLKNYEVALRRSDGSHFPALLSLRLHGHGATENIDVITRDISDLKEIQRRDRSKTETLFRVYGELSKAHQELRKAYAEVEEQVHSKTAELRQAYEALQSSDRVKTEFLMKMSHELRTPLNCIIGYSEAMIEGIDGPLSDEQSASLERISQSGQRLLRLIENLLDLSRIESGRMDIVCMETSLEAAVEDVLHQVHSLIAERPIQLEVSLEPSLPNAWADPDRLHQVLFNLIGNAIKFTTRGKVMIQARQLGSDRIEVRVSDTGPGIPADQLSMIFEKFVQLPGGNRSGAGLGLAICREIIENMGGRIHADSELGVGSTFIFTLSISGRSGQLELPLS